MTWYPRMCIHNTKCVVRFKTEQDRRSRVQCRIWHYTCRVGLGQGEVWKAMSGTNAATV